MIVLGADAGSHHAYDLVIRGGRVFDGLGGSRQADVAVHGGLVVAIGQDLGGGAREVDASGLWVTPGFVDIHTHYDLEVELDPGLNESVRHGVTTCVMGGCSLSLAYGEAKDLADIFARVETLPPQLIVGWLAQARTWPDAITYYQHLSQLSLGPNLASMLGHSCLRVAVMGLERALHDRASDAEIAQMSALATKALDAGAIGISVDMVHWHRVSGAWAGRSLPSHHADYREFAALAELCRERDAVFQSTPNPQGAWSFINILRLSPGVFRAPLRHTVLSALDMDMLPWFWRLYGVILFVMNGLMGCNLRFQTLCEPFTIYSDGHLTPFFEEFPEGVSLNNAPDREARRALYADSEFRAAFIRSWTQQWPRTFHRDLSRIEIVAAPDTALIGTTIATPERFLDLMAEHDEALRWKGCGANMRPEIRLKLMTHRHILPGFSDAGAHGRNLAFFDNATSFLRQAVTSKTMTPEAAIRRVTSEPARWFNLDAGRLVPGARADIVLIDPDSLSAPAPEPQMQADPVLGGAARLVKRDPSRVIRSVFIAGKAAVEAGEPTRALGQTRMGRLLRQQNPTASSQEALRRFRHRISDDQSLDADYWQVFLLKHRQPANLALHAVGFFLMYAVPVAALALQSWWLLLLWPLSQITGLIGHALFEPSPVDQRDAVFSWRAFVALHRMMGLLVTGRYGRAAEAARRDLMPCS